MEKANKPNELIEFLKTLENNKVNYVIWKNLHKLDQSLKGLFNIDIYIPFSNKFKFIEVAKSNNCIKANNYVNNFPFISHFYLLGENNKVFHIHTYYKLITGESFLKEFILPIEDLILENRIKHDELNIWVVNKKFNAYIFTIRHFLKCGSLLGRKVYKKQISSYKEEWDFINFKKKVDLYGMPFIKKDKIEKSNLFDTNFQLPNFLAAIEFRNSINNLCRFSPIQLFFIRNITFIRLLINKYIKRKKKVLPQIGIVISFTGVDGSGKSTINENISKFFGEFMTVENFHIGKPQGLLLSSFISKIRNKNLNRKNKVLKKEISFFASLIAIYIAILRKLMADKIKKKANNGYLLFVDRWPTNKLYCMDGPRIEFKNNKNFLIKYLSLLESKIYNNFFKADLCLFFKVDLETALMRNLNRKKKNKETQSQIIQRFHQNASVKPISKKIIYLDNNFEYKKSINKVLKTIWKEISDYSFKDNFL